MLRSDKAGQLCLSLPEVPSNFAKDNRLTNSAQEIMISDLLLNELNDISGCGVPQAHNEWCLQNTNVLSARLRKRGKSRS